MAKRILFIHHYDAELEDTAWRHLGVLGYDRVTVKPFKGESLPNPQENFAGIVIYGGSQNVSELDQFPFLEGEIELIRHAIQLNIPLLGICLGGQLIAHALGGKVQRRDPLECEFGFYGITPAKPEQNWIPSPFYVAQAHYEEFSIPPGAIRLAGSDRFQNQAFRFGERVYALQFHPETTQEIFEDWQKAEWAMYGENGAQSKVAQDALLVNHSKIQLRWFENFLESLFPL